VDAFYDPADDRPEDDDDDDNDDDDDDDDDDDSSIGGCFRPPFPSFPRVVGWG
jgi:hypothetical protein